MSRSVDQLSIFGDPALDRRALLQAERERRRQRHLDEQHAKAVAALRAEEQLQQSREREAYELGEIEAQLQRLRMHINPGGVPSEILGVGVPLHVAAATRRLVRLEAQLQLLTEIVPQWISLVRLGDDEDLTVRLDEDVSFSEVQKAIKAARNSV